jgi:hypothetical protein
MPDSDKKDDVKANNDLPNITNIWGLAAFMIQKHGSLTFGIGVLLIMWHFMVTPELERNQISIESHRMLIEEMHQHSKDQTKISEHLHTTAEILDRITAREMK